MDDGKKKLIESVSKRERTIMVGSLAKFESHFGFLWGDRSDDDLPNEVIDIIDGIKEELELAKDDVLKMKFLNLWQAVRTAVFNAGNDQIRACKSEVDNYYDIRWRRKQYTIPFRKGRNYDN